MRKVLIFNILLHHYIIWLRNNEQKLGTGQGSRASRWYIKRQGKLLVKEQLSSQKKKNKVRAQPPLEPNKEKGLDLTPIWRINAPNHSGGAALACLNYSTVFALQKNDWQSNLNAKIVVNNVLLIAPRFRQFNRKPYPNPFAYGGGSTTCETPLTPAFKVGIQLNRLVGFHGISTASQPGGEDCL